jgi:hypothetical protein
MSRTWRISLCALAAAATVVAAGAKRPDATKKKVLVELYTSQG